MFTKLSTVVPGKDVSGIIRWKERTDSPFLYSSFYEDENTLVLDRNDKVASMDEMKEMEAEWMSEDELDKIPTKTPVANPDTGKTCCLRLIKNET